MGKGDLYYNSNPRGRKRGREKSARAFSVFDWLMLAVSVVVAVCTLLSWMARWIEPAKYGLLSSSGLLFPILFGVDFLSLLYWVIRLRWGAMIPLVPFVLGVFSLTMFFRPQFTEVYADHSRDRSLVSVASYNVRGMMREIEGGKLRSNLDEIVSVIDSLRPDVLCMQEFQSTRRHPRTEFEDALPLYHYNRTRFNIAGSEPQLGWGLAIYSKFPIAASGHIDFEGTSNAILWADVVASRDTVRVFNAHLQTTAIKASDERYIVHGQFVADSARTSKVRKMVGMLTQNDIIRAAQADSLARGIAASPYPVVVCGDFNDTPASYTYHKISKRLRDSFREAGSGYGYTYRGFFDLLRIDYVLHSRSLECVEYRSPAFDASDHNPVAVRLKVF